MHRERLLVVAFLSFLLNAFAKDVQIVTYWGQNSAYGEESREERDLVELCREDSSFDIINIGFVKKFFDPTNADRLPGLDFAGHCNTPIDESHKTLFSCPVIERGIRECQRNGKKVLIALGGPRGSAGFDGEAQAEKFAENIWNLFLGGQELPDLRPFSSAVCDGVNLYISGGTDIGYPAFIRHLFYLAKRDNSRRYIITATPSCTYPDSVLGPAPNKALDNAVKYINHIYIRFYGANCGIASNSQFDQSLDAWLSFARRILRRDGSAPLIFIGVPAMERASPVQGCYRSTRDLRELYKRFREENVFGGFMIWDASWDQSNVQYGKTFTERLYATIENVQEEETENYDEEEEDERPIEPPATDPTTPITLATTPVPQPTVPAEEVTEPPPPEAPSPTQDPTPPPTPPSNPSAQQPQSPDENPYGEDDEMEQENQDQPQEEEEEEEEDDQQEPEETAEQEAAKPTPEEGQPEDEEEEDENDNGEGDVEDDEYSPRPPDMENRFPQGRPAPDQDEKAYQEEMIPLGQAARLLADKVEKEIRHKNWLRLQRKKLQKQRLVKALHNQMIFASGSGPNPHNYQLLQPVEYHASGLDPGLNGMQQNIIPQTLQQQQPQQQLQMQQMQPPNGLPQMQPMQQQQQQRNEASVPLWDISSAPQQNPVSANNNWNTASQYQQANAGFQVQQPLQNAVGQTQQPIAPAQQQNQPMMTQTSQASKYPYMPTGFFIKQRRHPKARVSKLTAQNNKKNILDFIESSNEIDESSGLVETSGSGDDSGSGSGLDDIDILDD